MSNQFQLVLFAQESFLVQKIPIKNGVLTVRYIISNIGKRSASHHPFAMLQFDGREAATYNVSKQRMLLGNLLGSDESARRRHGHGRAGRLRFVKAAHREAQKV